jgi:nucleolar MIF4G domain-containing protein 1
MFTSSQKAEQALSNIFSKANQAPQMVRGLQFFLKNVVSKGGIADGYAEKEFIKKSCARLEEVLTQISTHGNGD